MSAGKKHKVSAYDPEDGAACSDAGNCLMRLGQGSHQTGCGARQQIKNQESARTAGIFHAAAEHPQEKHIANEVGNSAMQEHARDPRNDPGALPGPDQTWGDSKDPKYTVKPVRGKSQLPYQDQGIDHD